MGWKRKNRVRICKLRKRIADGNYCGFKIRRRRGHVMGRGGSLVDREYGAGRRWRKREEERMDGRMSDGWM